MANEENIHSMNGNESAVTDPCYIELNMAYENKGVAMNGNESVNSIADYLDLHCEPPCEPYINEMHTYKNIPLNIRDELLPNDNTIKEVNMANEENIHSMNGNGSAITDPCYIELTMANDKTGVAMNGNERVTSIADYLDSHFEPPCEPYINEMHAYKKIPLNTIDENTFKEPILKKPGNLKKSHYVCICGISIVIILLMVAGSRILIQLLVNTSANTTSTTKENTHEIFDKNWTTSLLFNPTSLMSLIDSTRDLFKNGDADLKRISTIFNEGTTGYHSQNTAKEDTKKIIIDFNNMTLTKIWEKTFKKLHEISLINSRVWVYSKGVITVFDQQLRMKAKRKNISFAGKVVDFQAIERAHNGDIIACDWNHVFLLKKLDLLSKIDKFQNVIDICVYGVNNFAVLVENELPEQNQQMFHAARSGIYIFSQLVDKSGMQHLAKANHDNMKWIRTSFFELKKPKRSSFDSSPRSFVVYGNHFYVLAGSGYPTVLLKYSITSGIYKGEVTRLNPDDYRLYGVDSLGRILVPGTSYLAKYMENIDTLKVIDTLESVKYKNIDTHMNADVLGLVISDGKYMFVYFKYGNYKYSLVKYSIGYTS